MTKPTTIVIFGATGDELQLRQRLTLARAVRVTAEYGEFAVGVLSRRFQQNISQRLAGEVWRPFIV